jgi:hypothetical protein
VKWPTQTSGVPEKSFPGANPEWDVDQSVTFNGLSGYTIVCIILGGIVFMNLMIGIVFLIIRRKRQTSTSGLIETESKSGSTCFLCLKFSYDSLLKDFCMIYHSHILFWFLTHIYCFDLSLTYVVLISHSQILFWFITHIVVLISHSQILFWLMRVVYNRGNIPNQELEHCLESRLIEEMNMRMHMIQFVTIVKVIQIKWTEVDFGPRYIQIE